MKMKLETPLVCNRKNNKFRKNRKKKTPMKLNELSALYIYIINLMVKTALYATHS